MEKKQKASEIFSPNPAKVSTQSKPAIESIYIAKAPKPLLLYFDVSQEVNLN